MKRVHCQAFTVSLTLFLVCILGAGCASTQARHSGFLNDYSGFEPGPKGGADLVYVKPAVDWESYDKIMIDPIVIWYHPDAQYKGINPTELQQLADYFKAALIENLEDAYSIVDTPGPDTLRFRVAITNVVPTNPELDAVTSHLPQTRLISQVKKITTGSHLYVGGASLEGELLDSRTDERLIAGIISRSGEKKLLQIKEKWSDVREIMDYLAKRFRQRLDEGFAME